MAAQQRPILVLGGTGLLGEAVVERLNRDGSWNVLAPGRSELDLTQPAALDHWLANCTFAAVVNCAAATQADQAESQRERFWCTNAWAVGQLARLLAPQGVPLIHISTDLVFGADRERRTPYTENDSVGPLGYYGISKLLGEYETLRTSTQFLDWPHFILRTAGLFGWPKFDAAGELVRRDFPSQIASRMRDPKNRPIAVVADVFTSLTLAEDLAEVVAWFVEHSALPRGIYHATNGGSASWFEAACCLASELKLADAVIPTTRAEFRTKRGQSPELNASYTAMDGSRLSQVARVLTLPKWSCRVAEWATRFTGQIE